MTRTPDPVWCYCRDCDAWIGSQPCVEPPNWSNRKAQALHKSGQPTHRTVLVGLERALAIAERSVVVA